MDALKSVASGAGLVDVVAGVPAVFAVSLRDEFGVACPDAATPVSVSISGTRGDVAGRHTPVLTELLGICGYGLGPSAAHAEVAAGESADLRSVRYTATAAGSYVATVMVRGRHIAGSPFAINVVPGTSTHPHDSRFEECVH